VTKGGKSEVQLIDSSTQTDLQPELRKEAELLDDKENSGP